MLTASESPAPLSLDAVATLYVAFRADLKAKRNPQQSQQWKSLHRSHKRQLLDYINARRSRSAGAFSAPAVAALPPLGSKRRRRNERDSGTTSSATRTVSDDLALLVGALSNEASAPRPAAVAKEVRSFLSDLLRRAAEVSTDSLGRINRGGRSLARLERLIACVPEEASIFRVWLKRRLEGDDEEPGAVSQRANRQTSAALAVFNRVCSAEPPSRHMERLRLLAQKEDTLLDDDVEYEQFLSGRRTTLLIGRPESRRFERFFVEWLGLAAPIVEWLREPPLLRVEKQLIEFIAFDRVARHCAGDDQILTTSTNKKRR